jgi:hypothetical protein
MIAPLKGSMQKHKISCLKNVAEALLGNLQAQLMHSHEAKPPTNLLDGLGNGLSYLLGGKNRSSLIKILPEIRFTRRIVYGLFQFRNQKMLTEIIGIRNHFETQGLTRWQQLQPKFVTRCRY